MEHVWLQWASFWAGGGLYEWDCGVEWCDSGGLQIANGSEVGRMQMSSQFKWGCFFIHEGLIESWCGGDEWNMHGAVVLYQPARPMINFSSVLCGLVVVLKHRTTHSHLKWICCSLTDSTPTNPRCKGNRKIIVFNMIIMWFNIQTNTCAGDLLN